MLLCKVLLGELSGESWARNWGITCCALGEAVQAALGKLLALRQALGFENTEAVQTSCRHKLWGF